MSKVSYDKMYNHCDNWAFTIDKIQQKKLQKSCNYLYRGVAGTFIVEDGFSLQDQQAFSIIYKSFIHQTYGNTERDIDRVKATNSRTQSTIKTLHNNTRLQSIKRKWKK